MKRNYIKINNCWYKEGDDVLLCEHPRFLFWELPWTISKEWKVIKIHGDACATLVLKKNINIQKVITGSITSLSFLYEKGI